ncbi:MAG: homoserine O-acetyltransferase [Bacteroidota bacterium]|nr:homoserine O-acetyltransferase [Bacteroidota bacterium]
MPYGIYSHSQPFTLEYGITIPGYHLAYTTHGELNKEGNNVVWVFHALTANSDASEWWPGLVGEGKLFDPSRYFVVCVNMPGSCYGSIGPLEVNPQTGEPWYHAFPFFTTRDMVRSYQPLIDELGIKKIQIGIGGSMGGQQLLEWAILEPALFEYIFPLATNARHSPWGIAFNTAQRMCIEADGTWKERNAAAGIEGMKAARSTALISYRHYDAYLKSQPRSSSFPFEHGWDGAASYQRYQGEKLAKRFNAFSYYVLSQSMDVHDVSRGRTGMEDALRMIKAKTLVIGIQSDILFPIKEQQFLADTIPGAELKIIDSSYGHDGFLLEYEQIENAIKEFLGKQERSRLLYENSTIGR